jgi:PAS domain S-box-containing protein
MNTTRRRYTEWGSRHDQQASARGWMVGRTPWSAADALVGLSFRMDSEVSPMSATTVKIPESSANHSPAKIPDELPWKTKILLVDDNAENLIALEAVLESPDHDLVKANSGIEALRYLLDDDFAAILLDVKMPEMDGFETAALIRARKRSQYTPILFLTAYKSDEQLYRGYDLGAVDFLFKPIVPEVLQSKVAAFVQLSRNAELLKRQAEVLQRAEQKFRALLEAAPDAMVITGPDGKIDLINGRAESLFQWKRQQLIGQPVTRLVPGWTGESMAPPHGQLFGVRADGSLFPVDISSSSFDTADGAIAIDAIRDVTDRKKAEEEIHQLNSRLEQKVIERTAALTRSNEELRQFAYVVSHDLKEPLRTVSTFSQLLEERLGDNLDSESKDFVSYILSGVKRMSDLIDDLLAYASLDAAEARGKPVDLNLVLQEASFNLLATIQESGAVIQSDPLPEVMGDHVQLVQVLQNLIGNSIKYRSADPPRIRLSAESRDGELAIVVRDNGIGIDPAYSEGVFKLFKRLHARHDYSGNGVGLAICRKIVQRHGGRIWVESTLGQGAAFYFTIASAGAAQA